jgi:hypothetical protein
MSLIAGRQALRDRKEADMSMTDAARRRQESIPDEITSWDLITLRAREAAERVGDWYEDLVESPDQRANRETSEQDDPFIFRDMWGRIFQTEQGPPAQSGSPDPNVAAARRSGLIRTVGLAAVVGGAAYLIGKGAFK